MMIPAREGPQPPSMARGMGVSPKDQPFGIEGSQPCQYNNISVLNLHSVTRSGERITLPPSGKFNLLRDERAALNLLP